MSKFYLVFSDSHGRFYNVNEVISRQITPPDAIFFLGDGIGDVKFFETGGVKLYSVFGNCDKYECFSRLTTPEENTVKIGGYTVMMTHGHKYNVKSGLDLLINTALDREVDILLFGHTHEKFEACYQREGKKYKYKKPLYVLNPGSVGGYGASFGCITVSDDGQILLSHGEV